MGQWLLKFAEWFQKSLFTIAAQISIPKPVYTVGEKIIYTIQYTLNELGVPVAYYSETVELDTAQMSPGPVPVASGYGTNASAETTLGPKQGIGTGKEGNDYNDLIITHANNYGILPGVLKAIIHKETEDKPFDPHTYRYEPFRDYSTFSGPGIIKLSQHPYNKFSLAGKKVGGTTVSKGEQVDSLNPPYTTYVKGKYIKNEYPTGWSYRGLVMKDLNGDGVISFAELVQNDIAIGDVGSQNWPLASIPDQNFTAQVIISASYGLGHVLYESALTIAKNPQGQLWFDTSTSGAASSTLEMIKPNIGIELAAGVLKNKFNAVGGLVPDDNCDGWSAAVKAYNGSTEAAEEYKVEVCKMYITKYKNP